MLHRRLLSVCVASLLICLVASAQGQQKLNYHVADYVLTNLKTVQASRDKAQLLAREFVKDPKNKGPVNLDSIYFKTNIVKRQPLGPNESLAIQTVGNAGPVVPAVVVATAMQEVDAAETDDSKLLTAWEKKQSDLLAVMNQGAPLSILDDDPKVAWQLFLRDWTKDAIEKSSLRDGLKSAPYEFLSAMLEIVEGQKVAVTQGPSGAAAAQGADSSSSSGGYYPLHERMMNHIYWHHDRRMNRAERIRARR